MRLDPQPSFCRLGKRLDGHLAGALAFASSLVVTLQAYRLLGQPEPLAARRFLTRQVPA